MQENNSASLPYSFDLFFDIKTRVGLVARIRTLESELKEIREIMTTHAIVLSVEELKEIEQG